MLKKGLVLPSEAFPERPMAFCQDLPLNTDSDLYLNSGLCEDKNVINDTEKGFHNDRCEFSPSTAPVM